MQITFIVNSQIKKLRAVLHEIGEVFYNLEEVNATILQTHHAGHAKTLAQEITEKGSDYLIGVGGDGTLNELLNGMIAANVPSSSYPILGVLPRGSANDFVKTSGSPVRAKELLTIILSKKSQKIDIGKIVLANKPSAKQYFINIASLGLGPEVVKLMDGKSKLFGSTVAYFSSILKGFSSYKKRHVVCQGDDWKWEGDLLQMAVANAKYFAHGLCVAPEASVTDGLLNITLFGKLTILDYLKNLNNLKKGKKINHYDAHYFGSKEVTITPQGQDSCGIESDGEYVGESPTTITVVPCAIKFISV